MRHARSRASGSATGDLDRLDGFASQSAVDLRIDLAGMGCSGVGWVHKKLACYDHRMWDV